MGLKDFLFNNDYSFLLQIAIILLSTKLLGLLTKRISLPQVDVYKRQLLPAPAAYPAAASDPLPPPG